MFELKVDRGITTDTTALSEALTKAVTIFQSQIVPLKEKIKIQVSAAACGESAYNFKSREVVFCPSSEVINSGLSSIDVILHETFHAMFCAVKPTLCLPELHKSDEIMAVHEALADFFAYTINPDDCFGEGFYKDKACVRKYKTSLCYNCAEGPHGKGSALVTALINSGFALSDISKFLAEETPTVSGLLSLKEKLQGDPCFQSDGINVEVTPLNYPMLSRSIYWLEKDKPLQLKFGPSSSYLKTYSELKLTWFAKGNMPPVHFQISESENAGNKILTVTPLEERAIEEVTVTFTGSQAELIGSRTFGFGVKKTP